MKIRNGDLELYVERDGDPDAPLLLLLHGITSSGRSWEWLLPHLTTTHCVLRLDFRGHGESDRAPGAYQMQDYVSDAVAVCEQVALRPTTILGHSLGGGTAAALAEQRPDLVEALVLEDPPLVLEQGGLPDDNALIAGFQLMRQSVPVMQQQNVPAAVLADIVAAAPSATGVTFGSLLHRDALDCMAVALLQLDATVLDPVVEGRVVTAFDPDRPIPVRTLVIAADPASPDAVARTADVERVVRASPMVDVRVVSGAGHLIHDELAHRATFLEVLRSFLDASLVR